MLRIAKRHRGVSSTPPVAPIGIVKAHNHKSGNHSCLVSSPSSPSLRDELLWYRGIGPALRVSQWCDTSHLTDDDPID